MVVLVEAVSSSESGELIFVKRLDRTFQLPLGGISANHCQGTQFGFYLLSFLVVSSYNIHY